MMSLTLISVTSLAVSDSFCGWRSAKPYYRAGDFSGETSDEVNRHMFGNTEVKMFM